MEEDELNESPFGTTLSMDQIEAGMQSEEPQSTDIESPLSGESIPEAYRGKSLKDVIAIAETARSQMNESINAAKEAALAAQRIAESSRPPERQPVEQAPKEYTREELQEIYSEDPLKAIEIIENQAARRISQHLEDRIAPLTAGTVAAAEQWARQEYATEFELFGGEIQKVIDSVPNKQVFSSKKGWDDAIAFVRGQKGNFEKYIEHQQQKAFGAQGDSAREHQRGSAGFNGRSVASSGRSVDSSSKKVEDSMSSDERSIAQRFIDSGVFKDFAEYRRWQKMGG